MGLKSVSSSDMKPDRVALRDWLVFTVHCGGRWHWVVLGIGPVLFRHSPALVEPDFKVQQKF